MRVGVCVRLFLFVILFVVVLNNRLTTGVCLRSRNLGVAKGNFKTSVRRSKVLLCSNDKSN